MTLALLLVNLAVFIIVEVHVAYDPAGLARIRDYFALSNEGLAHGKIWQFFTFQFLHGERWHFLFNMLVLYLFGRPVEESLGRKHFLLLYFASGFVGGVVQSILGFAFPGVFGFPVVGASAGILGLVAAFATLDPNREILMFFVLPMRAKYLLWISAAVAGFYILVPAERGTAHGAHLGGLLGGVAYVRWIIQMPFSLRIPNRFRPLRRHRQLVKVRPGGPPWLRGKQEGGEELPAEEFISREVDPILDKISAHGIQSLTPREKQILEAARAKMEKR
jgi:membrane associated rhomboid family serine protease